MFVLAAKPTFTHTVVAQAPVDGGFERQEFEVTYLVLSPEESAKHDLSTGEGSEAFLKAAIVSLGKIVDEHGNSLPYSAALRDRVIALPWARSAIARGYFTAISKAAEGN